MGLLDNLKGKLGPAKDRRGPAKDKVPDLAQHHGGTAGHSLDRVAKVVDDRTGHKYSDRIQAGTGKAKQAMDRIAHRGGTGSGGRSGTAKRQGPPSS